MKKIVSVDDEPMMLKCLERVLEGHGYKLFVTSDPDEGLKVMKEDPDVCLALLDIKMPRKNGFDIYKELRQFKKIPVLFVTAYPKSFTTKSDEVVNMWKNEFADGTTDIIYKPFDLPTLYEKVEGLIGKAKDAGDKQ
ncbi:MAG: response regulator [Kiritimatiellae bacterium]|nr:response regulator [Kiritimatiellia bacterium]MDD5522499.1 response regulator [Kiritimatiellia bacterium]